jgi:hypothetical protein
MTNTPISKLRRPVDDGDTDARANIGPASVATFKGSDRDFHSS